MTQVLNRQLTWTYGSDVVLIPIEDIDLLLVDWRNWRAWALALKAAGSWKQ